MLINLIYIYLPVISMIAICFLPNRFEPHNDLLKTIKFPLVLPICLIFVLNSSLLFQIYWYLIPGLQYIEYVQENWNILDLIFSLVLLLIIYLTCKFCYNISINKLFKLNSFKLIYFLKICIALAIINGIMLYYFELNMLLYETEANVVYLKSMGAGNIFILILLNIVIAPAIEEIIFRGFLYVPMYRKVGRNIALILSSFLWAHSHFSTLVHGIGIFILGIIFGLVYDKYGSLIYPMLFHGFKNSWILIYIFF